MSWRDTTLHEINCTYDYDDNYADNDDDDDECFSKSTQRVRVVYHIWRASVAFLYVCRGIYIYVSKSYIHVPILLQKAFVISSSYSFRPHFHPALVKETYVFIFMGFCDSTPLIPLPNRYHFHSLLRRLFTTTKRI